MNQPDGHESAGTEPGRVCVFFYGSFINLSVLARSGVAPKRVRPAVLPGFALRIQPLANLVRSDQDCVHGITCQVTHDELQRLYSLDWVGTYLPQAVLTQVVGGGWIPALCYLAPDPAPAPAQADYVERIARPGREYGFPDWYLRHIESFRPA